MSLPTPYWTDGKRTIYHGDCREILPHLPKVDLVLTDPPYGINKSGQRLIVCRNPKHNRKHHEDLQWDSLRPDQYTFRLVFSAGVNQIIWGGNYFTEHLPASMGWIVWDKGQDLTMSDAELAFTSYDKALRRIVVNRSALAVEGTSHPTQKPLEVIRFCITYAGDVQTILDPFMGSGTTLVAAKGAGLIATGIEREEKYCEIAAKRLSQTVLFDGA